MYFIKSFFSHILAFIFFCSLIFVLMSSFVSSNLNYENIYNVIQKSGIVDDEIKNNNLLKDYYIPDELLNYIEVNDIFYKYFTDKLSYEFGIIKVKPTIDCELLNDRLETGIEQYIDIKAEEYSGEINSLLEEVGLNLEILKQVKDYIENNTSIDFFDNEYIEEKDLQEIYQKVDKKLVEFNDKTKIIDIVHIFTNNNYYFLAIAIMIVALLLIALINFNIISAFTYSIAPLVVTTVICLIIYLITNFINFDGSNIALVINDIKNIISVNAFKYFILLLIITLIDIMFFFLIKHLNIVLYHKKGVTTLDTIFDDYNSEEVVREINERNKKKGRKKKKEENKERT